MLSPMFFEDTVTLQSVAKTYTGVGSTQVWTNGATLWACLAQQHKNVYTQTKLQFDQRFQQTQQWRVIMRGKQDIDYALTRLIWHSTIGDRILKPTESVRWSGNRHCQYSSILVEDITDMAGQPV